MGQADFYERDVAEQRETRRKKEDAEIGTTADRASDVEFPCDVALRAR